MGSGRWDPVDVSVDRAGNVVVADSGHPVNSIGRFGMGARVRVVAPRSGRFYGRAMTAGDIYTVAGYGAGVSLSGLGGPAVRAGIGTTIGQVSPDSAGNLLIAARGATRVLVLAAKTGTFYGQAMTADHLYDVAGNGSFGYSGDGGPATAAELSGPESVTVDGAGNLLIADPGNYRVREVAG